MSKKGSGKKGDDKGEDSDAIDEEGFQTLATKIENKQVEEVYKYRGYDIYTYFISNVDTYIGRAIIKSIRGDQKESQTPHTIIGTFLLNPTRIHL